jgi:putative CocE/NonD family hydrolase
MRQPYGRTIASSVVYAHPSWYAARGFLVVVQDVRGQGDSEGRFGRFAQEAADGADAVRWLRRLPECNGRVGTYGFSYQGATQLLIGDAVAESDDPDPLPDCLVPAMCGLDERLHWASEGGAHWWALGLAWALQLAAMACRRRRDTAGWQTIRQSLDSGAFLREGPALLERHDPTGMGLGWLRLDPADPEPWCRHQIAPALLRRPLLLVGGWFDPHLNGVLELWHQSRAAGGQPQLRLGAWSHLDWRGGIDALQLAFFRRHLQDITDGGETEAPEAKGPIQLQCAIRGHWLAPLPIGAAPTLSWRLASTGLAAAREDDGRLLAMDIPPAPKVPPEHPEVPLQIVHDPWRPVPGRGGHLGLEAGPVERADLDRRCDVACFTTAPLEHPLLLIGRPQLALEVSADQPAFDLCAALSLVPAEGPGVRQVSTGVLRCRGGDRQRRQITFQPLALALEPGDRLRLSLAGAAWPQIAVNPGDGRLPWGGAGPEHRPITLTLRELGSRLWLDPLLGAN